MSQDDLKVGSPTITVNNGTVLKLEIVKLHGGDKGFRSLFLHNGQAFLAAKLLPLGIGPKNKEQALELLQHIIQYRPDLIYYWEPGSEIEYRI